MQNGVACGKIEGADPPTLAKRVQELAAERVAEKADGEGGGLDQMQPELQAKLKKLIRCVLWCWGCLQRSRWDVVRLCCILVCVRARRLCLSIWSYLI